MKVGNKRKHFYPQKEYLWDDLDFDDDISDNASEEEYQNK